MTPVEAAPGSSPVLAIDGVSLWYDRQQVLHDVSLLVAEGEFVALLGPSGCGKTSLLRSVAGFAHPQRGDIRLKGRGVAGLPPRKRNIGLLFQNYALFAHMSVRGNVAFGPECRGLPRPEIDRRVDAVLALVGLSAFADRMPKRLSGGQQQRVALARALVIEPDLLLLDEPLGALDKQLRLQMQRELRALQKRLGVTAVFVTHDQEEAMSLADRIVVMREGRIERVATPEALYDDPGTARVCEFLGTGNVLRGCRGSGDRLECGPGLDIRLPRTGGPQPREEAVFIAAERLKVRVADPGEAGLAVTGRRFLGSHVELVMGTGEGALRALVAPAEARSFPVGATVTAHASPADIRRLEP